jgi:hypothetical protein
MSADADIAEDRHGRILAELAGLSLELARDLQARALAAETAQEAARLASAIRGVARGLRQTLALELRVAEFRRLDAADAELARRRAAERREEAVLERQCRIDILGARVRGLIWSEYESLDDPELVIGRTPDEARGLERRFEAWLDARAGDPAVAFEDVEGLIDEVCGHLGIDRDALGAYVGEIPAPPRRRAAAPSPEPADTG